MIPTAPHPPASDTGGRDAPGGDDPLEFLALAAIGNEHAFERLVQQCHGRLERWALVATGDTDDADDVVQETWLRVHRSLAGYRREARFTTWLYRILRSVVSDLERRRASRTRRILRLLRERGPRQEPATDRIARIDRDRKLDLVRAFLEDLPPGQRQVMDLVDMQGFAPAEVARMLEMNPSTVRAHLFKARRSMRRRMLEVEPALSVERDT